MPSAQDIALIRVQLDDVEPAIWRRFAAPVITTLKGLHDLLQAAMGWQDYHLWEFEIGRHRYGDPDSEYLTNPPTQRAAGVKLAALIARGDLAFSYVYDFGDNWRHTVQVEGVEPAQSPTHHILTSSKDPGAARPKMSAEHLGSRAFSKLSPRRVTQSAAPCSTGTVAHSTPKISIAR